MHKKNIYTIAAVVMCHIALAQTQQTLSVQPEKAAKGTPAVNTTNAAKEINPNTSVEPVITHVSMTVVPSPTLDPNITPSVGRPVETKKNETAKNPK